MHFALAFLLLIVTFFSACSTISTNQSAYLLKLLPPPIDIDANQPEQAEAKLTPYLEPKKEPALKWWARYELGRVWAKSNPEKSCQNFLQASEEPGAPLAHLALLRSLEVCGSSHPLDTIQTFEQIKEPWLVSEAVAAAHLRSVQLKNESDELYFTPLMVKQAKLQSQKVTLLNRGIELASKTNQPSKKTEFENELFEIAPRFNPSPKEEDFQKVANDFKHARDFAKAREFYNKVIENSKSSDLEKYRALDGIRLTYKLEDKTRDYLRTTSNLAQFAEYRFKKKALRREWIGRYHDSEIQFARAIWTKKSALQAKKIVLNLQNNLGNDYPLTESYWLLARIAEEAGHFDEAVALLEKIDLSKSKDADLKQRVLWYKAWNLRRGPRWQDSIAAMKILAEESSSNLSNQSRVKYWLARTEKDHGQADEAKKTLETIVTEDPLGYYGILASRDLDLPFHSLPSENGDEQQYLNNRAFANSNDGVYFEWLTKTGEHQVAQQFLDFLFTNYQTEGLFKTASLFDFLRMYPRVSGYKSLFARISDLPVDTRNEIAKTHPSLLFPMPWIKEVNDASAQFQVEPEFVYAIMRQESSFDPHARSGADAFGLLQLIPKAAKTAKQKVTNVKYDQPEDLYDPEVNIPLGAAFLADTLKHYKGQLVLTAAAYNASEEAIKGWLKTRLRNDPTEFIEDIPYDETRTYVKLVLRNYLFYKRLNLREPTMNFPERCLEGLQAANP